MLPVTGLGAYPETAGACGLSPGDTSEASAFRPAYHCTLISPRCATDPRPAKANPTLSPAGPSKRVDVERVRFRSISIRCSGPFLDLQNSQSRIALPAPGGG